MKVNTQKKHIYLWVMGSQLRVREEGHLETVTDVSRACGLMGKKKINCLNFSFVILHSKDVASFCNSKYVAHTSS